MRSLTYVSSARVPLSETELEGLLREVRAWNAEHGLTGMMLYSDGNFIQSLEGAPDDVEVAFGRITDDPRHHGILVMLDHEVAERAFPTQTMGYRRSSTRALGIEGFTDFLQDPAGAVGRGRAGSAPDILLRSFLPPDHADVLAPRAAGA